MRRIGILGGTFNPVHKGHLNLARALYRILKLDKVIFVPSYIPPHKKLAGRATSRERLKMVKLAIKGNNRFGISLFEIDKKETSYSIDTLRFFKKKFGRDTQLFFLTGADSLAGLKKWKSLKNIFKLAEFIVATRPGYKFKKGSSEIEFIRIKPMDISSTKIRQLIKNIPHLINSQLKFFGKYKFIHIFLPCKEINYV